jgi:ubiquinone/menaquinone biosynthesis C-methylase UbiE
MARKSTPKHHKTKAHKLAKPVAAQPVEVVNTSKPVATQNAVTDGHTITADQYNDPSHNYLHYWEGRDYENQAEIIAIKRLLKGRRFRHAVDIGGGYGRLCVLLEEYAEKVTLAEPSQQQLDIAADYLKDHPRVDRKLMQVEDLQFADGSIDLFTMIRVMHHLPDPEIPFRELARTLSDDGYLILEMANYTHFRNRLKHLMKGQALPEKPVDIRSAKNLREDEIPFVNHNPKTVIKQLAHAGLRVEKTLSVSNLRSPGLKKVMPHGLMVSIERALQQPLASSHFGPSVFFLVRKAS